MSHPIFEQTTSPLVHSNDGQLQIIKASHDSLPSTAWEVVDLREPVGERTVLRTYSRELAWAYIAGYDEAERRVRAALQLVGTRLDEVEHEYALIEPGINDDSVLEAERDTLQWALGEIRGALRGGA